MKTEQLKPIVAKFNNLLIETLVKISPGIDKHYWANNPSFNGLRFLIEKVLPEIGKAGDSEIKQILDLTRVTKDYFKIHLNSNVFATCYVFVNSAIVDGVQYDFDNELVQQYFESNYCQVSIKASYTQSAPFDYCMIDQRIDGFTKHTFSRLTAEKTANGEIEIYTQICPNPSEISLLPELDNELKIERSQIIVSVKTEWTKETISETSQKIKQEFQQFAHDVLAGYEKLNETFDALVSILNGEIELRKNNQASRYLRLKFDSATNKQIIDFLFQELNNNFFHTSQSNFESVFTPKKTIPIKWEKGLNAFLKLFFGFENLKRYESEKKFDGLIEKRKDVFYAIANCFTFKDKPTNKPMHEYISSKASSGKLKNSPPREMTVLLPIIQNLKTLQNKVV